MSTVDLAWAAGFFDAEGCFSKAGPTPVATISQSNVENLDVFAHSLGFGEVKGPYAKATANMPNRKPQWVFSVYGRSARDAYERLAPWLGDHRHSQAAEVFGLEPPAQAGHSRREQLAWAAGFFDGEGCFTDIGGVTLSVRITQTDRTLLERFEHAVGFGKIYGPYRPNTRAFGKLPTSVYAAHGFERVQATLALLWPNLSSRKRVQAMDLLNDYRTYWKCGHRRGPTWKMHCPHCFKPGPKPGGRQDPGP